MNCKNLVAEIRYYFSIMHGEKAREGVDSPWFPLDKMMEAIYYSSGIAVSYGLPLGDDLLQCAIHVFRKKINNEVMKKRDECLSLDPKLLIEINEIMLNLKLRLQISEENGCCNKETGSNI